MRPRLRNSNLAKLGWENIRDLEAPFTEDEIWGVLSACDGNRAQGPDGFNLNFFKSFWPVLKEDILRFFAEFYTSGKLVKGLNAGIHLAYTKKALP